VGGWEGEEITWSVYHARLCNEESESDLVRCRRRQCSSGTEAVDNETAITRDMDPVAVTV
jgi:hypothetical protein